MFPIAHLTVSTSLSVSAGQETVKAVVRVALLAALVGQLVALPATEVTGVRGQVQLAHAALARHPTGQQWAEEPPAQPAEPRTSRAHPDRVTGRLRLVRAAPGP